VKLLEVVLVSLVAAVTVTATYSFALLGYARSASARRDGRPAAGYVALMVLGAVVFAAVVIVGVDVMLSK